VSVFMAGLRVQMTCEFTVKSPKTIVK